MDALMEESNSLKVAQHIAQVFSLVSREKEEEKLL